jgi:hypothetical protein
MHAVAEFDLVSRATAQPTAHAPGDVTAGAIGKVCVPKIRFG